MNRTRRKTAAKTAVTALVTTRQPHGGALLAGGVAGNKGGSGRPRSEVRLAALEGAAKAVPLLEDIVTRPGADPKDVIGASRVLLEYGVGRQVEIEDAPQPEERMTGEESVRHMAQLMPRLVHLLNHSELLALRDAVDRSLQIHEAFSRAGVPSEV